MFFGYTSLKQKKMTQTPVAILSDRPYLCIEMDILGICITNYRNTLLIVILKVIGEFVNCLFEGIPLRIKALNQIC